MQTFLNCVYVHTHTHTHENEKQTDRQTDRERDSNVYANIYEDIHVRLFRCMGGSRNSPLFCTLTTPAAIFFYCEVGIENGSPEENKF